MASGADSDPPPQKKRASLAKLCKSVITKLDEADKEAWTAWGLSLQGFDALEDDQQLMRAARGLRLCQMVAGRRHTRKFVPASDSPLHQSTESLTGIGPKMAASLADRGLETVEDLLWLVPRRYDDVRNVCELEVVLKDPPLGTRAVMIGDIDTVRFVRRGPRGWIDLRMKCDSGTLVIRWFNARAGMCKRYEEGGRIIVAGKISERGGCCEMANPDVLALIGVDGTKKVLVDGVVPRYSDVPGVPASTLRKACQAAALRSSGLLSEIVPTAITDRLSMASLSEAIASLHHPPDSLSTVEVEELNEGRSEWHRRLAFEELFVLALVVGRRRLDARANESTAYARPDGPISVLEALPFSLTGAQERVIAEIGADLGGSVPMNRLLQGDVGSGKTAVALASAAQVVSAGGQVALMAPTTILAEQHYRSLSAPCQSAGIRIALLTASTPKAIRSSTLSLLSAGAIDVLIGTHALLADSVVFRELGLVIIDEQHRFGVEQRARLRAKGTEGAPHLLVMTATPIPRTLALTAYGDLDVSILDEMPPGRQPPRTQILQGAKGKEAAYRALRKRVKAGERAYVVCPMVEASEESLGRDCVNATDTAALLSSEFQGVGVSLLHGRMSSDERDEAMQAFRTGASSILVATTVIEVGVDVPEAIVIMIEDADRFGLAQLHQLRGRVGRGGGAAECVLLTSGSASEEGRERLNVLVETCDGFVIAEEDLRMRGPGELLGVQQAGLPRLRFGDLREHGELLASARVEADALIASDPQLVEPHHKALLELLERRDLERQAYGAEGG